MLSLRGRHLLAVLLLACTAPPQPIPPGPIDVQGHRGARGLLPENTLPAFEHALELGVTTLELDLGRTRDGTLVVTHDPRIEPGVCLGPQGTPVAEPGPRIHELTLAEVQAFDCGSLNPDPARFPEPPRRAVPGARIPTLGEVLDLAARRGDDGVRFNVEVKVVPGSEDTPALEPFVAEVIRVLERHDVVARATLQSFDWRALAVAKRLEPRLRTVALLARDTLDARWLAGLEPERHDGVPGLLRAARSFVDDFSPSWRLLLPRLGRGLDVAALQREGFQVIPWTVNDRATMERLLALGVDGIITDYPDRLLALLRDHGIAAR